MLNEIEISKIKARHAMAINQPFDVATKDSLASFDDIPKLLAERELFISLLKRCESANGDIVLMGDLCEAEVDKRNAEIERLKTELEEAKAGNCNSCYGIREGHPEEAIAAELLEAYRKGQVIVLPCNVGNVVFEINTIRKCISTLVIASVRVYATGDVFFYWDIVDGFYQRIDGFPISSLDKTVFLNRAEAEAALERQKER